MKTPTVTRITTNAANRTTLIIDVGGTLYVQQYQPRSSGGGALYLLQEHFYANQRLADDKFEEIC